MSEQSDYIIIGGGIAGASCAAALADIGKVTVLEREDTPGYHSTSRSAATYVPSYGPPTIIALTKASGAFFNRPPDGFCDGPLLRPRGELMLLSPGDEGHIPEARKLGLTAIDLARAKDMIPILKTDALIGAYYDPHAQDIDVDLLHQGYLRHMRNSSKNKNELVCRAEVTSLNRADNLWHATTTAGIYHAPIIINAAGAWADKIAELAAIPPLGITPKRRSAVLLPPPDDWQITDWPLTFGAGETFYFRPMGGQIMVSPADATPVEPHDAWADDMLIAEAIEKYQNVTGHEVSHISHSWGGLRSFAPDGNPVIGYDEHQSNFFWLAGQGGYGIQTAPAIAKLSRALIERQPIPDKMTSIIADLTPQRFCS